MSVSIIWINHDTARIYHFSDDRMEREVIPMAPALPGDALSSRLENSKQILVLSPGEMGKDWVDGLRVQYPHLAKRVVGCEVLHIADDVQIAEYAIKYFRKPVARPVS